LQINQITIENLRNIAFAKLYPKKTVNIFVGNNGAGKTTLLESIYLLARARTFRQQASGRLIKDGEGKLNLFAKIETSTGSKHQIGLQKNKNKTIIRKDGENLKKLSELARSIPLTIITTNIQYIIEEDPNNRRRLLNWGLFHVEHEYGNLVNRYNRALFQRNNALRRSIRQLKVWDEQVIKLGSEINSRMDEYIYIWNRTLNQLLKDTGLINQIDLQLKKGWKEDQSLEEALERNLKIDKERGFTSAGPHRSDVRIVQDSRSIKGRLSRGEIKIAAVIMVLSQTVITEKKHGESPILLVDDLHSELDSIRHKKLLGLISDLNLQSFVTALKINDSDLSGIKSDYRLFHVEHGAISGH
jgi:DNA replication and repair protein RecF